MNCLEARKQFRRFWRQGLPPHEQSEFISHLDGCAGCDHSFRLFALTAPVLQAQFVEARVMSGRRADSADPAQSGAAKPSLERTRDERVPWGVFGAAIGMALAAAVAVYFSLIQNVTFEDAITDTRGIARATYSPGENLLGVDAIGPVAIQASAARPVSPTASGHHSGN
jgi:hypothetical protein